MFSHQVRLYSCVIWIIKYIYLNEHKIDWGGMKRTAVMSVYQNKMRSLPLHTVGIQEMKTNNSAIMISLGYICVEMKGKDH